jgi:hypothetical protein
MSKFRGISKLKCKNWGLTFDIPLSFACLREAASAKAGISTFGIK